MTITCVKCEEVVPDGEASVYLGYWEFAHHACVGLKEVICPICKFEATGFPSGRIQCHTSACPNDGANYARKLRQEQ